MLIVHARILDPMSRAVRLALGEKRAAFHTRDVLEFEPDAAFNAVSPDGRTPVLVDDSWGHGATIGEALAIFEYLEDLIPVPPLLPGGPLERANVRALSIRAARALGPIVETVVDEKARKMMSRRGAPDTAALRQANIASTQMLDQIGQAADAHGWIGGKKLSIADMVAAAHFLKQRPAFKPLLIDSLKGVSAPVHYADLDF